MLQTCRGCGRPIRWARTESGSRMPLDLDPTRDGTIVVIDDSARVLSPIEAAIVKGATGVLFVSHFATCPDAGAFRKKTR